MRTYCKGRRLIWKRMHRGWMCCHKHSTKMMFELLHMCGLNFVATVYGLGDRVDYWSCWPISRTATGYLSEYCYNVKFTKTERNRVELCCQVLRTVILSSLATSIADVKQVLVLLFAYCPGTFLNSLLRMPKIPVLPARYRDWHYFH
jgi:hypothetical protein